MAVDMTKFSYALQHEYSSAKILDVIGRDHAFLAMLMSKCKVKTSGDYHVTASIYSNGDGRSATFSTAQGNPEGNRGVQFLIPTVEDYAVVQILGSVLDSADGVDAATFFKARVSEIDGKMEQLGESLAHAVWRSGSGSIGQVISTQSASSTTITLANPYDAVFFRVGMRLVADSVDGGGTVGTTISFVKSVDIEAGTFTASATDGGAAATATTNDLTADQYIFPYGDYDGKLKGVQAWLPAAANTLFGVDRTVDRLRLCGYYADKTGVPVEQAILDAATFLARTMKARPEYVFLSQNDWTNLNKSLSSKVQLVDMKPNAETAFFFKGIQINGPKGVITCIMDGDIPDGYALITQMDVWELIYKGKDVIRFADYDGNRVLRTSSTDGIEARIKYNAGLGCRAPGHNAWIKLR